MTAPEKQGDLIGTFPCNCCCGGQDREQVVYNDLYWTCKGCNCNRERGDTRLKIRVYAMGQMTVSAMEKLLELANLLGASNENVLMTENAVSHHIDIPAEGIFARLEIAKITTPKRPPK